MKKQHLPAKICQTCDKPFAWRKKWKSVWDEVKFCSERCRINKRKSQSNADAPFVIAAKHSIIE